MATSLLSFVLSILLLSQIAISAVKKGCRISISDIDEDSPIILRHRNQRNMSPFLTINSPGTDDILLSSGEGVRFACPDADTNKVIIEGLPDLSYEVVAYCKKDSTFTVNSTPFDFKDIRCEKPPQSTIQEQRRCEIGTGKLLNIGFKLKRKFFGIVQVCYNPDKHRAHNVMHLVSREIQSRETDNPRSSHFSSANFGKDLQEVPDTFYTCKKQLDNFAYLLGSTAQARKYIVCGSYYLTRGHLAPNADFMFGYQQKATSYYINTAPQWHTINSGNWKILEGAIRKYAGNMNTDLTVVTGTLNVGTLPNVKTEEKPLYMVRDKDDKPTVPVPALFWKLVVDKSRYNGIVFVGVNDPHHINVEKMDYIICKDVCDKTTSWFDGWDRFKVARGYVYCCTVADFSASTGIKIPFKIKKLLV
ncbi:hypothetical protein L9F63_010161 [Diploptera punctata]|uniref:DNA/RNA non-specific endonuclease domain-containing protein n=1 Tax=Diploptera punctata TaxID=6984 RepID=A0AAD8AIH3_DIPPU|nr:hypothetical protein L9F63_010161 [Diploptera punctata]